MNVVQEISRINERELEQGLSGKASWHHEYKDSAWVFVGGFPYDLTEGDLLCFMSQWGEIEDINLCREKETGKSKGFCFIKYEDQRSTILAVDNFNGIQLLGRTLRVDHKDKYALPKEVREREDKRDEERMARGEAPGAVEGRWRPGVAYEGKSLATEHSIHKGVDVFAPVDKNSESSEEGDVGVNGDNLGQAESSEEKRQRREMKRARKEARRAKRELKKLKKAKDSKHKRSGEGGAEEGEEEVESDESRGGGELRKKQKKKKKEKEKEKEKLKKDGEVESREGRRSLGSRGDSASGAHGGRVDGRDRLETDGPGTRRDDSSRADADGVWERGARSLPGGFRSAFSGDGADVPASLSTSNVMDWRGIAGRGGGRGGRGMGRGRGDKAGGREERGGPGGKRDVRGSGGVNTFGGMHRRR